MKKKMPKKRKRYSHVMSIRSDIRDIAVIAKWLHIAGHSPESYGDLGRKMVNSMASMITAKHKDLEGITTSEAISILEQLELNFKVNKKLIKDLQLDDATPENSKPLLSEDEIMAIAEDVLKKN